MICLGLFELLSVLETGVVVLPYRPVAHVRARSVAIAERVNCVSRLSARPAAAPLELALTGETRKQNTPQAEVSDTLLILARRLDGSSGLALQRRAKLRLQHTA